MKNDLIRQNILEKIVNSIVEAINPQKIFLFGSRAKGTNHKGSDIDLAIEGGNKLTHREERKLKEKIEEVSGIYFVDLIFIEKVNEDFKNMIIETGKIIYEKK